MPAEHVIAPGLYDRAGILYMRMRWQGRLYRAKCPFQGRAAFGSRGALLDCVIEHRDVWQASIRTGEHDRVAMPAVSVATVPTLDAFCDAYKTAAAEQYAASRSPRPAVVSGNVSRMRGIAAEMGVTGEMPIDRLTPDAVRMWMRRKVEAAGADLKAQDRTRYSCWRSVAVARSMWAGWTRDRYGQLGIIIPDCLAAWPKPSKGAAAAPQFQIPPENIMMATVAAYEELEIKNPRLWLAATLCLMFAMRPRSDGSRAEWSWFVKRGGEWWLEYTPSKTTGRTSEGSATVSIRVPADLYERMRRANPADGYIVPGATHSERWDVFARDLCAWQRGNGWDAARYAKPAYMLRKLAACAVARATGGDVQAAANMLGISVATLLKHYTALFRSAAKSVDVASVIRAAAGSPVSTPQHTDVHP